MKKITIYFIASSCAALFIWLSIYTLWQFQVRSLGTEFNPFPEFLSNVRTTNSSNSSYPFNKILCVTINQKALWETNNVYDKLDEHLKSTLKLRIDNKYLNLVILSVPQIAVFHGIYDSNGKILGTYTEPFEACFDISDILTGQHKAAVQVESLSGIKYFYSWNIDFI